MLIDKVTDAGDYDRIHEVWDEMEAIGDEILVKMRADKEKKTVPVLRGFDISASQGIPFDVRSTGQYGVRFTFSLRSAVNSNIDPTKWLT